MTLEERIVQSLRRRPDGVLLRSELGSFGSASQISVALRSLQQRGLLKRVGPGVFVKPALLSALGPQQVAQRVFNRLGIAVEMTEVDGGLLADTRGARIRRNLRLGNTSVTYINNRTRNRVGAPAAIFSTATSRYVHDLADRVGVHYTATYGDRWAESVTRLAGDDVKTDDTEDLLVALKRAGRISGEEMVRLVVTHLREKKDVRPVRGL